MVLSRAQGYIYKHFIHKIITYSTYGEQFFISNLCWRIKQETQDVPKFINFKNFLWLHNYSTLN